MSRVGHHRGKYSRWVKSDPSPDLERALADCYFWLADGNRMLASMQGEAPQRASLLEHLAELEDAKEYLEGERERRRDILSWGGSCA